MFGLHSFLWMFLVAETNIPAKNATYVICFRCISHSRCNKSFFSRTQNIFPCSNRHTDVLTLFNTRMLSTVSSQPHPGTTQTHTQIPLLLQNFRKLSWAAAAIGSVRNPHELRYPRQIELVQSETHLFPVNSHKRGGAGSLLLSLISTAENAVLSICFRFPASASQSIYIQF